MTRPERGQPGNDAGASVLGGVGGWFGEVLSAAVSGMFGRGLQQPAPEPQTTPVYPITDKIRSQIRKHGESLEGSRFARAQRERTAEEDAEFARFEAGVRRLYQLFSVPPVPIIPVVDKHDGVSPIHASGANWDAQYRQLWHMLVPGRGPAATVQGEVIRIVGRLRHEIEGNGGGNWDDDFRAMQDTLIAHLASGNPVPEYLDAVRAIVTASRDGGGWHCDFSVLDRAAVQRVELNPVPIPLGKVPYQR